VLDVRIPFPEGRFVLDNSIKLTSSQIRYMICMYRLSPDGYGVKNVEIALALDYSKPSVHNMLKFLSEAGIVVRENFGLAHFSDYGRDLARKYYVCLKLLEKKMNEICGENATTEIAICGILADMPQEKLNELYEANEKLG